MQSALLRSGVPACLVIVAVACSGSSSSSSGDGGASSGSSGTSGGSSGTSGTSGTSGPPRARVTVVATLVKGTHSATECPDDGKALTIGSFEPSSPVEDGVAVGDGQVSFNCRVASSTGGFDANANVQLTGSGAGSFLFNGSPSATGEVKDANVSLTVQGQSYAATSCQLASGPGQGVAAGRYWANVTCSDATAQGSSHVCDIQGQLRIENCVQD